VLRRLGVALLGIVVLGIVGAGCAATGFNAGSMQKELIDAGLTERQAVCVTERLEDRLDARRLSSHVDPRRREVAIARVVLRSCGVQPRPR
jgi:hypothetical protein